MLLICVPPPSILFSESNSLPANLRRPGHQHLKAFACEGSHLTFGSAGSPHLGAGRMVPALCTNVNALPEKYNINIKSGATNGK